MTENGIPVGPWVPPVLDTAPAVPPFTVTNPVVECPTCHIALLRNEDMIYEHPAPLCEAAEQANLP